MATFEWVRSTYGRGPRLAAASLVLLLAAACGRSSDGAKGPVESLTDLGADTRPTRAVSPVVLRPGQAVPVPTAPVLAVGGRIGTPDDGAVLRLGLDTLAQLGLHEVELCEPWAKERQGFRGVWPADVLALAGVEAGARDVRMVALDDFKVVVPPDDSIPNAELSDIVCDLGRWVLHSVCDQLRAWVDDDPDRWAGVTVAVNISGRHLASSEIVDDVSAALQRSGLPARRLVLESNETVLPDEPAAALHLHFLRALGVAVSLDDFATGYTSIGQLQHPPVDVLMINRSFTASVEPRDAGAHRADDQRRPRLRAARRR